MQHATGFGDSFAHRQTAAHQSDPRLADVADDAVAIGSRAIERNRNLRFEDVFVIAFLDQLGDLIDGLAVDKDTIRDQRQRDAAARRNHDALLGIAILSKDGDRDHIFRTQAIGRKEVVVVGNDRCFFGRLVRAICLAVSGDFGQWLALVFVVIRFLLRFLVAGRS